MKKIARSIFLTFIAMVMTFTVVALTACHGSKYDYMIKVLDPDGNPYVVAIQPCVVTENDTLGACYASAATTDSNGIAYLTLGKEIPDKNATHIEVHLENLPAYYGYEKPRIHKGESVTIELFYNVSTPKSGTGEGHYSYDKLEGKESNQIESTTFDPYVVNLGVYKLDFNKADQKIYFAFKAPMEGYYNVSSVGSADVAVTWLQGNLNGGIRNTGESEFTNDNVSASDKNFSLEFEVTPELFDQLDSGICYFEVCLKNASDIGQRSYIYFEYVEDWVNQELPDVTDISPENTLNDYKSVPEAGDFVVVSLDGTFRYKKGEDGFYHKDDENGPVLYASLGRDLELNSSHVTTDEDFGVNAPLGLDKGFTRQYKENSQAMLVTDGKTYAYNYYPLIEAYTANSNKDGRYPINDELKNFLDLYINQIGNKSYIEKEIGGNSFHLPEGEEWLWACGYYDFYEITSDGSRDNPYFLSLYEPNEVDVTAGQSVWFSFGSIGATTLTLTSDSGNVSLKVYYNNGSVPSETATSSGGKFEFSFEVEAQVSYYLEFTTVNANAETYEVSAKTGSGESKKGTFDNPIEIDRFGTYDGEVTTESGSGTEVPVYFIYEIAASDTVLYFTLSDNAKIEVEWTVVGTVVKSMETDFPDGVFNLAKYNLTAGMEIKILVTTKGGDGGSVWFKIDNTQS